jgi:hypothetical protein
MPKAVMSFRTFCRVNKLTIVETRLAWCYLMALRMANMLPELELADKDARRRKP